MYMVKLDNKDSYYSVPICEDHESLLKFQYQASLFSFTTVGPRKFPNILNHPLVFLKRIEKILVPGVFDDLITLNSAHSSCCDKVSKITFALQRFVITALICNTCPDL